MPRRTIARVGAALAMLASIGGTGMARGASHALAVDTHVTVDAASRIGIVPATAVGLNASVYDGNLLHAVVPGLLRAAGAGIIRWPGGSEADAYHWQDNSITPSPPSTGGYANPNNTFDAFMTFAARSGVQAMITVNYGSNHGGTAGGDPQEAANWVRYADDGGPGYAGPAPTYPGASRTGHRYGITYWEIGNEVYGNGTYNGVHWETDLHPDALSGGAIAYGMHALQFMQAMKAADPRIKVGVVLTAPGNWPDEDAMGTAGSPRAWNDNVIAETCTLMDFADVHWYPQDPGTESDAALLQIPEHGNRSDSIRAMVSRLHQELSRYCPSRAGRIPIMVTEMNSVSSNPGKQVLSVVNALFEDDAYMTWLENGVANVSWWQLHNDPVTAGNNSRSLFGTATFGDYGVLADGKAPEPPADTPFPAYYGLAMLAHLAHPGDLMVRATSDNAVVGVHAVMQSSGRLAVMLINEDPGAPHTVGLQLSSASPARPATVYTYGAARNAITSASRSLSPGTIAVTLAPYSVTVIVA